MLKYAKMLPNLFEYVQICSNMPKYMPNICPNMLKCMSKYSQIWPNIPKCTQIYPHVFKYTQIYPSMPKYNKICPNIPKCAQLCANMPKCVQIYGNMFKYAQIYPNMFKCAQVCPNMPKYAQMCSNNFKVSQQTTLTLRFRCVLTTVWAAFRFSSLPFRMQKSAYRHRVKSRGKSPIDKHKTTSKQSNRNNT